MVMKCGWDKIEIWHVCNWKCKGHIICKYIYILLFLCLNTETDETQDIPDFKHVVNGLLIQKKKKLIREATLIDEI